jgi:diaminopimelate epimerase
MTSISFLKGHGAGNDFVIVPDVEGALDLTPDWVRRVCDRHSGIGADGVLRVVRQDGRYFMDYRNADGSLAETCGNGLRVFARYLVETGLERAGDFAVITRAGEVLVTVRPDDKSFDDIAVRMGVPTGEDAPTTHVSTDGGYFTGTPAWMPNPHCVSVVGTLDEAGLLLDVPTVDPAATFPDGANFEFIEQRGPAHIGMRTFERGVGETQACGSGACAAAHVWAVRQGLPAGWTVQVDVLGGTLYVDCGADGALTLRGPARIVAQGATWL